MDHEMKDRRVDARFDPPASAGRRATLRPGCTVMLVNVSAGGVLVRSPRPVRPGGRVHLQVQMPGDRLGLVALVVRCAVWSLCATDGVTYEAALKFDQRVEWHRAAPTRRVQPVPEHVRPTGTDGGTGIPAESVAASRTRGHR